jgi:hypothetical protein
VLSEIAIFQRLYVQQPFSGGIGAVGNVIFNPYPSNNALQHK